MIQAPRGTKDVLPSQSAAWQHIEAVMRERAKRSGYKEIRTPAFEHTELFARGVGDTTDIVQKEMYTFEDKGGRSITLKPEGTAGAVRLFLEHGLHNEPMPMKMFYLYSPVFRYEAPQLGRYREHHQFGVEVFGSKAPTMDAEVISLGMDVIRDLGIKDLTLCINSIGCPSCRPQYQQALKDFLRSKLDKLCPTCQGRFERNPLRILDCKSPICQEQIKGAPVVLDHLCDECSDHFDKTKEALLAIGIQYQIDPGIVRGLDYYTKTVFEVIATLSNGQNLTCFGGGRYDGLVEAIGGPSVPGIGFGMGMERILMMLESQNALPAEESPVEVYVATMGDQAAVAGFKLANDLRNAGISADCDHMQRSFKAQFKYAGKLNVPWVVVIGQSELESGLYTLRDMRSREEQTLSAEQIIQTLLKGRQ